MVLPKRVAIAVTSYNGPFYPDGFKTGAFYSEVYHPFKVFTDAGFEVDLVSENGNLGWDEHSLSADFATDEEKAASQDPSNAFAKAIANVKKATEVDAKNYGIINVAGGHGTIFDFVGKAPALSDLASKVWQQGGLVVAVCHGPCLLGDVVDEDGKKIVAGRKCTGFPDEGEVAMKLVERLDKDNLAYTQRIVQAAGGDYQSVSPPFDAKVVIDGRLISGANPASATPAAEAAVKAFAQL